MTTYCDIPRIESKPPNRRPDGAATPPARNPQDPRLAARIERVLETSPFYQRKVGHWRKPLDPADLTSLPFTTREELQADQAAHPPFGSYLACNPARIARVHRTSGSRGRPLIIALSSSDVEDAVACGARCFHAVGVEPGQLIIHCLNYCMWSGGVTDHLALERAGAGVIPFGVGNSSALLRTILDLRPYGIHCTPSYLAKLEPRLAQEFQLPPAALGLQLGLFGGEPGLQDPNFRARIERDWGFRAMDANYGMAEVLSMFGAECGERDGLHFHGEDVLHAELKDLAGDAVLPWEPGACGELVLTHLRRECQPLIRYRTSDVIEVVTPSPCRCGRPTPRWRVVGRVDDMVVIRGLNVYLNAIGGVIHARSDRLTGEYCVLVNAAPPITDCVVKIEVRAGPDQRDIGRELEEALAAALGVHVCVTLVPEGRLARTDGKSCRLERVL